MKIQNAEKTVFDSSGMGDTNLFKIRSSSHAFKILSSGLYSDKVGAVLREIGCNAYDAHVAAGIADKPFEVKLPNRLDTNFWIRDDGPGLDHDEIVNLFTTYFSSSKQDSNDYTGAFGLGSKSPFSYTDNYTIQAVKGGVQRTYSAYINNSGAPEVAKVDERPATSSWPNGLKIGFPVKHNDIHEFHAKAASTYQYFKTVPKILGGQAIAPVEYELKYQHGALLNSTSYFNRYSGVIMGNVYYPLNTSSTGIDKFFRKGIILFLDIGEAQVAASREELQYDPKTIKVLYNKALLLRDEILETTVLEWKKAVTWKEKSEAWIRAQEVGKTVSLPDAIPASPIALNSSDFTNPKVSAYTFFKDTYQDKRVMRCMPIRYSNTDLVIVWGEGKNAQTRVRWAVESGKIKEDVLLIYPRGVKPKGTIKDVEDIVRELRKKLVDIKEVKLETLTVPTSTKHKRAAKKDYLVRRLDNTKSRLSGLTKPYVWVSQTSRRTFHFHDTSIYWGHWNRNIHTWNTYVPGYAIPTANEVIVLSYAEQRRVKPESNKDWIELDTYVLNVLKDQSLRDELTKKLPKTRGKAVVFQEEHTLLGWLRNVPGIESILKKHNIDFSSVVLISAYDTSNIKLPGEIEEYNNLCTLVDTAETESLKFSSTKETEYKANCFSVAKTNLNFLKEAWRLQPALFPAILDDMLAKG